jgi:WD repeat-containing protein 19
LPALKVYRKTGNVSMVYSLEEIRQIEDLNLLKGHCAMLLTKVDEAKVFFAKSSNPQVALELCRDLLQWEEAIALAGNFDSDQVPYIAREYAQQLEFTGSNVEALLNYEMGLRIPEPDESISDSLLAHVLLCKSGIARTSIKTGDYKRGVRII